MILVNKIFQFCYDNYYTNSCKSIHSFTAELFSPSLMINRLYIEEDLKSRVSRLAESV